MTTVDEDGAVDDVKEERRVEAEERFIGTKSGGNDNDNNDVKDAATQPEANMPTAEKTSVGSLSDTHGQIIDLVGFGRYQLFMAAALTSSVANSTMELYSLAYILIAAKQDLSMTTFEEGLLTAATQFGLLCGALILTPLADKYGRKRMLVISVIIDVTFVILAGCVNNYLGLLVCMYISSVGLGPAWSLTYALAIEICPTNFRGRLSSSIAIATAIGQICVGLAAYLIIKNESTTGFDFYSWRGFIISTSLPGIFTIILFAFGPFEESQLFLMEKGRFEEARGAYGRIFWWNNTFRPKDGYQSHVLTNVSKIIDDFKEKQDGPSEIAVNDSQKEHSTKWFRQQMNDVRSDKHQSNTIVLSTIGFLTFFSITAINVWAPVIIYSQLSGSFESEIKFLSYLSFMVAAVSILPLVLNAAYSDRTGRVIIAMYCSFFCGIFCAIFGIAYSVNSVISLCISYLGYQVVIACQFTLYPLITAESFPVNIRDGSSQYRWCGLEVRASTDHSVGPGFESRRPQDFAAYINHMTL